MEKIIAKSYARLIKAGRKTMDDVPEKIKPYMEAAMTELESSGK